MYTSIIQFFEQTGATFVNAICPSPSPLFGHANIAFSQDCVQLPSKPHQRLSAQCSLSSRYSHILKLWSIGCKVQNATA